MIRKDIIMKKTSLFLTAIFALALIFGVQYVKAADPTPDGKTLFTEKKCISCHSIESQKLTHTNANSKAPDLSLVGDKHNAEFIGKYLKKEETINDKKHGMAFKGTDDEFKAIVSFLAGLKAPVK